MATYALTFATRAAFDTSLASGDIYNLMQGVTSSKPSVAITATITESGETFACGTNVMVDIKSVGPGDRIMYDSTNDKFFGIASKWIDNNYPYQPTQHIMIFKTGVLPARYVDCGVCVKRFGNRIRVAGEGVSLPWSTTASSFSWNVDALTKFTYVVKKSRTATTTANTNAWCSLPSPRYTEAIYPNGNASYMPITRSAWNAAVVAGEATVTGNSKTITLADYDNNFDKYLAVNFIALWPASEGAYFDKNGFVNTGAIVADYIANHGKTAASADYAAGYCKNYTKNAPGLGKNTWFLGVVKDVGELRALTHTLPVPTSWGANSLWSATAGSTGNAFYVYRYGSTRYGTMNNEFDVIPLADLILEN